MKDVSEKDGSSAVVVGAAPAQEYTIEADWRMFELMIANLYADKPLAVVRELSTNALDSHIDAGTPDLPFDLTLPTQWERVFTIRDYGISLTHEQVMVLYTRLGKSTKNDSNATTGKFGLGCKSPFAYTDSFTVCAYLNGVKRTYNALKGGPGQKPSMVPFGEEPTDEPNGLEVSFAVRERDIQAFHSAAKKVMMGFKVMPKCNIPGLKSIDSFKSVTEGTNWRMLERDYNMGLTGFQVRQGCVLYPVTAQPLRAARPQDTEAIDALSGEVLVLDMPIGSVDITPSRETLSYDPTTVKNLLDAITGIYKDYVRKINDAIGAAGTLWEAVNLRHTLLSQISNSALRLKVEKNLRWRNRDVLSVLVVGPNKVDFLRRVGADIHVINTEHKGRRGKTLHTLRNASQVTVQPNQLPSFIYWTGDAAPSHMSLRIAALRSQTDLGNCYVLPNFTPGSYAAKALLVALGRPPEGLKLIDLSAVVYEKPDYKKTLAQLSVFDHHGEKFEPSHGMVTEDTDNVFYVHTYRNDARNGDNDFSSSTLAFVWKELVKNQIIAKDAVLVGIPASRKDLAKNIPDEWEDFFAFAGDEVRARLDVVKAARFDAVRELTVGGESSNQIAFFRALTKHSSAILDTHSTSIEVQLGMMEFDEKQTNNALHSALRTVAARLFSNAECEKLFVGYDKEIWGKKFRALVKEHNTAYPLIAKITREDAYNSYRAVRDLSDGDFAAMVEYINFRDPVIAAQNIAAEEALRRAEMEAIVEEHRFDDDGGCLEAVLPEDVIDADSVMEEENNVLAFRQAA